ncbi:MAG: FHA domain-containing protein [Planctomycetota bacterium]|nr:FHA domain-containing protein [Planctomycetota bacterium]
MHGAIKIQYRFTIHPFGVYGMHAMAEFDHSRLISKEHPSIAIIHGPLAGEKFELRHEFRIGRASDADISLPEQTISRAHACIVEQDGVWLLQDRGEQQRHVSQQPPRLRAGSNS